MEVNVITHIVIDEDGVPTTQTEVSRDNRDNMTTRDTFARSAGNETTGCHMARTGKTTKEQECCPDEPTIRRVVAKPVESSWWCCGATPQKPEKTEIKSEFLAEGRSRTVKSKSQRGNTRTMQVEEIDDLFRDGTLRESVDAVSQLTCCRDKECCKERPCCKRKAQMERTYKAASERAPTMRTERTERTYRSERAPTYKSERAPTYRSERAPTYKSERAPTYRSEREPTYRSECELENSFVEDNATVVYTATNDENSCCSKECCDDIKKPCIGAGKNRGATTYREPTYVSQREPTYVSQREPTYVSQREPTYVSQREPTYESEREASYYTVRSEREPTYRSQSRREPTYRSQREPTYRDQTMQEERTQVFPTMRSGVMRSELPDEERFMTKTHVSRTPTLATRSTQKTNTPRIAARTFQGF